MSDNLTYLGILAAPTSEGRLAVGVALTGAVELYHLVDAGLDTSSEIVRDWLWTAGINPEEAEASLPPDVLISDILLPAIGDRALVVHHEDMDISLVDKLVTILTSAGNPPVISGLELSGPIAQVCGGAAGRRAFALQARYEAALQTARQSPAVHRITGSLGPTGELSHIAVSGPFAERRWTLDNENDAFLVLVSILHLGDLATFQIDAGPAKAKIKFLANQIGLDEKLAA